MEEQYIDIANTKKQYQQVLIRLDNSKEISPRNKELLRSFFRDAALGKTIIGKKKKKIGFAALVGYFQHLLTFMLFVKKDLDKLTNDDMERYIEALETDVVRSRALRIYGNKSILLGSPYSPRYKVDNKVTIRKFYKWLWGNNRRYPKLVEWFDTYAEDTEIPALLEHEVELLVDNGRTIFERSFIQSLFDGGYRLGEILNIRLKHVRLLRFDEGHYGSNGSMKCFALRVPFSKTFPRTVPMPMPATTKWLSLWLDHHPANPVIKDDGTLEADDLMAQLYPTTDTGARHRLNRLGKRVLNKRVYPHLLRHSSATHWANKLSYFQLCKRFGWTMTSKQPQRYIDRAGIDQMAVVEKFNEDDRMKMLREKTRLQTELTELKAQMADISERRAN